MPILRRMAEEQSDAMIFLGDNIYADTEDMAVMRTKYERLGANPDFQRLQRSTPFYAIWDDHDYGVNDGGAEYPRRAEAQREFLRFWNVPADSPRWQQQGIYDAVILGPPGQQVQLLLLDVRYFRSPLKKGAERLVGGWYVPDDDPTKTMLGEAQWKWLEEQLRQPAELRILATGIQCVPEAAGQETWANLPRERQRLFDLIRQTEANGVIILSGDRHWAEFSRADAGVAYPLYDFTSSSLNQLHPRGTPTENRLRSSKTTYHRENYGRIRIDWQQSDPALIIEVCDQNGLPRLVQELQLSQLR